MRRLRVAAFLLSGAWFPAAAAAEPAADRVGLMGAAAAGLPAKLAKLSPVRSGPPVKIS